MDAPPKKSALGENPRILIIRFSSLGDVVKTTALPRLIKKAYPKAKVVMLTSLDFAQLFAHNPYVNETIGFDRKSGFTGLRFLIQDLKKESFDLVVDVHRSLRSRVITWFLSAPRTHYSKRTLQRMLLIQFRINTYKKPVGKEVDFLAGLLPYGVKDDGQGTALFAGPSGDALGNRLQQEKARIAAWRKADLPVLGIAPIAAWDLKCWPLEHFTELVKGYFRATGGGVLLFGGPGDGHVETLIGGLGDKGVSLVGRTSHMESAWFASLTDLMVANDTGMTHLAEAVGVDALTFYGPTSRELGYYPVRPGSKPLELALECRPCTRTGKGNCRLKNQKACLVGITPAMALAEVLKKLG